MTMTPNQTRTSDLLDQWGSDPANWPEAEREAMTQALAVSPELQQQAKANAEIDAMIATPPPAASLLEARLLRDFRKRHRPFMAAPRLGLLAASFLCGLIVGTQSLPLLDAPADTANAAPVEDVFTAPLMPDPFSLFLAGL